MTPDHTILTAAGARKIKAFVRHLKPGTFSLMVELGGRA